MNKHLTKEPGFMIPVLIVLSAVLAVVSLALSSPSLLYYFTKP